MLALPFSRVPSPRLRGEGQGEGGGWFDEWATTPPGGGGRTAGWFAKTRSAWPRRGGGGGRGGGVRGGGVWGAGGEENFSTRHKKVLDAIGDQARYIGPI